MTNQTAPPDPDDEPAGPAAWALRLFGRPVPTTDTPTSPAAWHQHLYPKENS